MGLDSLISPKFYYLIIHALNVRDAYRAMDVSHLNIRY